MPLDFAIVPRWRRGVLRISYALSNAILEVRCGRSRGGVDRAQVIQIVHLVRLAGCDAVAADPDLMSPDRVSVRARAPEPIGLLALHLAISRWKGEPKRWDS
jgi:hypothetical protein